MPPEPLAEIFQAIPGIEFPSLLRRFYRLDFGPKPGIATQVPPVVGHAYPLPGPGGRPGWQ